MNTYSHSSVSFLLVFLSVRDAAHPFVLTGYGLCLRGDRERHGLFRGPGERGQRPPIEQSNALELATDLHDSGVLRSGECLSKEQTPSCALHGPDGEGRAL